MCVHRDVEEKDNYNIEYVVRTPSLLFAKNERYTIHYNN